MAKPAYIWDGSAWVSILGPSVTSIDDLSDVVITSPSTNQILQYNGTNWVNATNSGGSSSNSFETIAVSGQSNVVADSSTDTLTLVAGSNITITTNATSDSITIAATDTNTTYSAATSTTLGLIELFSDTTQSTAANAVTSTASRTYGLQINSSGQGVINVPWTDTTYSAATSTALGLIELFSDTVQATSANAVTSTASRTYGIQVNGDGQAVVNVPWTDTDTNTTYSISAETTTGGANLRLTDSSAGTDDVKIEAGTNMSVTRTDSNTIKLDSTGNYTSVDSITYPDYITFDTTPETVPTAAGSIYWDSGESAPGVILNANVELRLGQEEVVLVKNATGSSIPKGSVVYINGAAGQRPTIALSDADTEATSSKTLGLTAETIADGAEGFVTTFGVLRGVNTDGLSEGAMLWLSSTAGGYTTTVPAEPAHSVFLGYVVKAHISSGEIFVNVQNGYELTELHGVTIEPDNDIADNEVLAWDDPSGLWKNQTASEAGLAVTAGTLAQFASTTSSELAGVISDETGSGALVFATSPSLTTPTLGVASATSINKVAITAPATGSTLTISDGKTLTASNTLTFTGTDGSTLNIGTGGTLGTMAYETASNYALLSGATFTGDIAVNGGDITSTATTFNLLTSNVTTLNVGSASTTVAVAGGLTVAGDLTVNGTTTNINTTNLVVEDKNIVLGDVTTPSNTTADGGGITLKGASDKTLNWVNATSAWTSSEDFNLLTGKVYEIDGTTVLSATALGTGVTGSSLTSVGTIGTGVWQGTVITSTYGGTGVNNGGRTITLNTGNLTLTANAAGSSVTVPASGTLATTSDLSSYALLTGATFTGDITLGASRVLIFEGATDDTSETTLTVTDPTADRTITLPDATGTVLIAQSAKAAGYFDTDTVAPSNTNRLNYDGYLYATRFYGDGSQLTGVTASASPYETITTSTSPMTYTAPTVVGTSTFTSTSTTGTFNLPSNSVAGNLCIIFVASDGGTAVNLPSGWTSLDNTTQGGLYQRIYYKTLVAGDISTGSVSISGISTATSGVALSIANFSGTPAITSNRASLTDPNAPSVTTTIDNSLVVIFGAKDDQSYDMTGPTGYTGTPSSTQGFLTQKTGTAPSAVTAGLGYRQVSPAGVEDPAAFGGGGGTADDTAAHTIVITPLQVDTNFDVSTSQINYYTSNPTADITINFRGNSTTTLDSLLSNGQSVTCALLLTNGATPYKVAGVDIDGTAQTIKWINGSAPTGNASSIDSYVFTIIKTATNTFTVLGGRTKYA